MNMGTVMQFIAGLGGVGGFGAICYALMVWARRDEACRQLEVRVSLLEERTHQFESKLMDEMKALIVAVARIETVVNQYPPPSQRE